MLAALGRASIEELFADIPRQFRFPPLDLDEGLSETETLREISALADRNINADTSLWFLGAGAYNHFVPAAVGALASRGEFLTAYTPYQAEVSQGTLQAIFEYQSMIAGLTGMDVVNAGHYDGAAALAEAVIMALKHAGAGTAGGSAIPRVLIPEGLHPEYREVLKTYLGPLYRAVESYSGDPVSAAEGAKNAAAGNAKTDAAAETAGNAGTDTAAGTSGPALACLVAAYPDFFGIIPDLEGAAEAVHAAGGLLIVQADPIMLGLFKSPGEYGADIVTAEGQCLGNDMNYGGPFLGIMAVTGELMRRIPGRIAGEARDAAGRRGYVLTLSAREQHIRRERAVSNICSNQGLVMLRSCIYLALLGKQGLRQAAELCWRLSHYAASELAKLPGFSAAGGTFFKEFVLKLPYTFSARRGGGLSSASEAAEALYQKNIVPGLPLSRYFPGRTNELLVCVTENNSKADIDRLTAALAELYH
jgi:glycine dehydrogenase subunit 1